MTQQIRADIVSSKKLQSGRNIFRQILIGENKQSHSCFIVCKIDVAHTDEGSCKRIAPWQDEIRSTVLPNDMNEIFKGKRY